MVPGIHGGAATSVWISQPTVDVNLIDGPPDSICNHDLVAVATYDFLDSKVHGANMEPIWGRQDPGGPYVDPMNLTIWVYLHTHFQTSIHTSRTHILKITTHAHINAVNIMAHHGTAEQGARIVLCQSLPRHLPLDKMAPNLTDDILECIFLNEIRRIPIPI